MLKYYYKILSIALLLLFATNLFHDVVPHVHHQHDVISSTETHTRDHHHNGVEHHHHSDENDKEQNEYSFFDFLFTNHSHSKHVHQFAPKIVEHFKQVKQPDNKVFYKTTIPDISFWLLKNGDHRYVLYDKSKPDDPFAYSNNLRGPPILG